MTHTTPAIFATDSSVRPISLLRVATILCLVTTLMGNLVRIPLITNGMKTAPLLPLDLSIALMLLVGAVELHRQRIMLDAVSCWGLLFIAVALLGLGTAGVRLGLQPHQLLFGGTYLVRWAAYFGIYVIVSAYAQRGDAILLLQLIRLGGIAFAAFGIVQALFLPDFALIVHSDAMPFLDWDPQRHRLVSTFLDPVFAGILLVIALSLWGGRLLAGISAPWSEGLLLTVALALTLSRGALIAGFFAAGTMILAHGVSRRVLRAIWASVAATLVAAPFLIVQGASHGKFQIDRSALGRLIAWQRDLVLLGDHPILGIGFNTLGFVSQRYGWDMQGVGTFGLDGGLLFISALTGFAGLTCFLGLLTSVIVSARRSWRDPAISREHRAVAYASAATVIAVTVHASFANTLLLPLVMAPCWLLWALPRVLRRADG